jgi:MYXO-CTERM domain-containing protein
MRDASGDVARLLYTAWVRAGKPLSLYPLAERREPASAFPYEYVLLAVLLLLVLLWPRRRRARS